MTVAALEAAERVRVLLPVPGEAMALGAKVAVTPFGNALSESATADLNPFSAVVDRLMEIVEPVFSVFAGPGKSGVNVAGRRW